MLLLEHRAVGPQGGHATGQALLRELVERHTGRPMPPIALGSRGKPYFPGSSLHFSITHTRDHVFCALSDRPIGIDAEALDRPVSSALAEKILSPTELAQYRAAPDPHAALLTFWVLKEAQGKCTGQGINGYPNRTHFSLDDPRVFHAHGCVVAVIEEEHHAL